jgi:hypothetical protein
MKKERTVYILGAGFSANAGLPLQSEFTKSFLAAERYTKGKSLPLMGPLRDFVSDTFGFGPDQDTSLYPELEDLFTTMDLSANTGHHLGPGYAPRDLRRLRRMLLSRIIRMLHIALVAKLVAEKRAPALSRLIQFVEQISSNKHQFVSLNWDVVLEGCLEEVESPFAPYYSPQIYPAEIVDGRVSVIGQPGRRLLVAKMHGSINWLYCDCCRRAFSVPMQEVGKLAAQVLSPDEVQELYGESAPPRLACPRCGVDLGVRLATFSFQKALRAPMFETSWLEAEKALRGAHRWVFIGYSLPAADFEFKYLLKRTELARKKRPEVVVVTKRSPEGETDRTSAENSYIRFFGEGRPKFHLHGLTSSAIADIL